MTPNTAEGIGRGLVGLRRESHRGHGWAARVITTGGLGLAAMSFAASAHADTFGGQVHLVRSRGRLDGREVSGSSGTAEIPMPGQLTLRGDGDLVGGSLRGELLLRGVRAGMGLCFLSIRGIDASEGGTQAGVAVREGLGVEHEVFLGYELLRGPFYGYVDLRLTTAVLRVPVDLQVEGKPETVPATYGAISAGFGPRVGLLVPLGHSLMVDFAAYQSIVGGIEGTTGFVGIGYWENDRGDRFSQRLRSGATGDF